MIMTFKTPDVTDQIKQQIADNYCDELLMIHPEEQEYFIEDKFEEAKALFDKYVKYDEYVTIDFTDDGPVVLEV